jgi:hypothetical protein
MKCEKCGKEMKSRDGLLTSKPPKFGYDCECGHIEYRMVQDAPVVSGEVFVTMPVEDFYQLGVDAKMGRAARKWLNQCHIMEYEGIEIWSEEDLLKWAKEE